MTAKASEVQVRRPSNGTTARNALKLLLKKHDDIDIDDLAVELDRMRRRDPLAHVIEVWDLSLTDVAAMFAVSRQAVAKWLDVGIPPDRAPAVADLAATTELLVRYIRRDRIPAVVRRTAPGLGGTSLLELAQRGDTTAVLAGTRAMFQFEAAND